MSDRTARLEELLKITGDDSIEELEILKELDLGCNNLTSVPLGVCDLTGLVVLWLHSNILSSLPPQISRLRRLTELDLEGNRLSSLPLEISQLTKLVKLHIHGNLIEELPPQITALKNMQKLYIQDENGEIRIKRAPRGITNLPCWYNTWNKYGGLSVADALRTLQLYDSVENPTKRTHKAKGLCETEETPKAKKARKCKAISRVEVAKQDILSEKELQFVQAQKTVHPEQTKHSYKPFAEGEIFQVQSTSATTGSFKVSNTDEDFHIERHHVKVLSKGCCGNRSPKDQQKRRNKLERIKENIRQLETSLETTPAIGDEERIPDEDEKNVTVSAMEIANCLAGALCALCYTQYNDPRILPCRHIFCSGCIKALIKASKEEPPLRCPLCSALVYVDDVTVSDLRLFAYSAASLGGMNANVKESKDKGADEVLKCKGRRCTEDATHYCIKCGEDSVLCETHGEMHMEVHDESHVIEKIQFGVIPSAKKTENCPIHENIPIEFFCPSCPESPLKCAKCVLNDRPHLDEHKELNQEGFDIKTIIVKKIQELRAIQGKLAPDIQTIEENIKYVQSQNKEKIDQLDSFTKELEDQVKQFKEQAKKNLESLNQYILVPLEEAQKKLLFEMHRIQIAKQTLMKIYEKPDSECSIIETENALRFANQTLYSKHNTPVNIASVNIVSRIPATIIDSLKKLNESFMFGLSNTEIEEQLESEAIEIISESLYSINSIASNISTIAKITFDSLFVCEIEFPWGICVHPKNGNIYVTDEDMQSVRIFDKNLNLISSHYTGLIISKALHGPRGIAISNEGLIAIADCEGHSINLYTDEFTFVKSVGGQKGTNEGQFNHPYSVAFDSKGNLYVADSGNMRVQKFNRKGEFISVIGNQSEKGGLMTSLVNGICVNEEDELLAMCAGSEHVRVFSKDGVFEKYVKLEIATSIEGWSHIFRASQGIFGICENKTGVITFHNYEGEMQHRITLDGCIGACFGLDSTFYATSLSNKLVSAFSSIPE